MLLCDRPHVKNVDFAIARFIVATASGLNVSGRHLVRGDEVPRGVLSIEALQQIYEPPLRLIETVEYAKEDPGLVEACACQGVSLDLPNQENLAPLDSITDLDPEPGPEFDVDYQALIMCDECGDMVKSLASHTKKMCKANQKKSR